MSWFLSRIVAGFIAGFIAVLVFHQGMYILIQQIGWPTRGAPFNMTQSVLWPELFNAMRMKPMSLPAIVNQSIWGGLFGVLFALMIDRLPGGISLLKGIVFGMIFPMLLGSWVIIPLIKGQAMFGGAFGKGFNPVALRNGFLLNGIAFGAGLGLLYPMFRRMFSR